MKVQGGVRKHAHQSPWQRFCQWSITRSLGSCGKGVFVDASVEFLRYPKNIHIGPNVIVKEGARICAAQPDAKINVGEWTTVGYHNFIFASNQIYIGANCLIAPFCYFVDANHGVHANALIREQPLTAAPIIIEDDVWFGVGVTVLKGVRVGCGAVIGAGAVLREDVPENAIVAAAESKVVDYRR